MCLHFAVNKKSNDFNSLIFTIVVRALQTENLAVKNANVAQTEILKGEEAQCTVQNIP